MEKEQEEKFNLEAPAINNYVNMILQDMKNYQFYSSNRYNSAITSRLNSTLLALVTLLKDMPPKGQEYMIQQGPALKGFNVNNLFKEINGLGFEGAYQELDDVYRVAIGWLWPNLLEIHFNNAQPRSKEIARIGVQS